MSLIARAPVLRQQILRSRLAAPSRGAHGEYRHLPFEHSNKKGFALKLLAVTGFGFSIPILASAYQL
ncbi:hypothetical protein EWM64_g6715 [Hericium alpestre]|uniref:Cytochrome c oxidase subunit 8, mitochondrial n=1 Tax=Hericium alpestre TaxID=135208 RepID=A0A4Y9ZQX8_9AGAM|nr:hypothetical protein EWM64_g6715 [Hericium alpestre]